MMVIIWSGKPAAHDTRMVDKVWFGRVRELFYTVQGSGYVHRARTTEVEHVVDEDTYRSFNRL